MNDAPFHAHVYAREGERAAAQAVRAQLLDHPAVLFVGGLCEGPAGPHPLAQFEAHFPRGALPTLRPLLETCGLTVLLHPLTLDDLADHTTLAEWIGPALELDLSVLDPPGVNQGLARYGKTDF